MLSDEEKKAIESLFEILEFANLSSYKDVKINQLNAIDVALNLIEKQQKEIEELRKPKYMLIAETGEISQIPIDNNYISKDKIKAEIKDITEYYEKEVKPEMYIWGDFTTEEHYADVIAILNKLLED